MGLKKLGNIYKSKGQAGTIYDTKGLSPSLTPAKRGGRAAMPIIVSTPTNTTNTPAKSTKNTMENATQETSEQLRLTKSQTTIYSVLDSLVRALASLERGKDLKTPEGLYFLKSLGLRSTKDPDIYSLKMLKVCLVTNKAKLSRQSLGFLPTWGIELNGKYLIASTLEFPKTGRGCLLSDILEDSVNEKYFLSSKVARRILAGSK